MIMILITLNFFRGAPNQMAIVHDIVSPSGDCHWNSAHYKLASEERKHTMKLMVKILFLFCENSNSVKMILSATAKTFLELTRLHPISKSDSDFSMSRGVHDIIISIQQGLGGTPLGLCHVESTAIIGVGNIHDGLHLEQLNLCLRLAFRVLGWGSIRHDISPNVVASPLRRCGSAIGCPAPIPSFSAARLRGSVMTGSPATCGPGPSIHDSDHY